MEITIANPYKGRLETVNIEFSDENTSYISDKEKTVSITDYHHCLIIDEGLGTYPVIVYGLSRSDIAGDIQKLLQLKEETLKKVNSDIELSIIKINDDSKFVGFNENENSLVPYESSFLQLSKKEYLLWSEGLNYHNKRVLKRYSSPLHITFFYSNKEDNFNEHHKYLQDILNLSGANYRGFNAKALPVSVYYPKLIAGFSKHFKELNLETLEIDKTDYIDSKLRTNFSDVVYNCKYCINQPNCVILFNEEAIIASHTLNGTNKIEDYIDKYNAKPTVSYDKSNEIWKVTWYSDSDETNEYYIVNIFTNNTLKNIVKMNKSF